MKFVVRMSDRATADVDETLAWLRESASQATANKWLANFWAQHRFLEANPERFGLAEESGDLGLPIRPVFFGKRPYKYRILFVVRDRFVLILRVRRGARDWLRQIDLF